MSPQPGAETAANVPWPEKWHTAHADGGARGNPGPAAIGAVLLGPDGERLAEISRYIGEATSNQAEYQAVVAVLEEARARGVRALRLCLDSELIVRQLDGAYRVRNQGLRPLFDRAKALAQSFEGFRVEHVPRALNREADRLVNRALDAATGRPKAGPPPASRRRRSPRGVG